MSNKCTKTWTHRTNPVTAVCGGLEEADIHRVNSPVYHHAFEGESNEIVRNPS